MKKKVLVSFLLIGLLAFGLGMGTVAWFTASVTSEGNTFTAGTFELNDTFEGYEHTLFNMTDQTVVQPGYPHTLTPLTVTNTGSLDMLLDAELVVEVVAPDAAASEEMFYVNIVITGDVTYNSNGWIPILQFKNDLETLFTDLEFDSEDAFVLSGSLKLHENAENEYQGATLTVDLVINGKQTNYVAPVVD